MMFTIAASFTADDKETVEHLARVIAGIAPYMVDNVEITITDDESTYRACERCGLDVTAYIDDGSGAATLVDRGGDAECSMGGLHA